jgi:hypothetical protein
MIVDEDGKELTKLLETLPSAVIGYLVEDVVSNYVRKCLNEHINLKAYKGNVNEFLDGMINVYITRINKDTIIDLLKAKFLKEIFSNVLFDSDVDLLIFPINREVHKEWFKVKIANINYVKQFNNHISTSKLISSYHLLCEDLNSSNKFKGCWNKSILSFLEFDVVKEAPIFNYHLNPIKSLIRKNVFDGQHDEFRDLKLPKLITHEECLKVIDQCYLHGKLIILKHSCCYDYSTRENFDIFQPYIQNANKEVVFGVNIFEHFGKVSSHYWDPP